MWQVFTNELLLQMTKSLLKRQGFINVRVKGGGREGGREDEEKGRREARGERGREDEEKGRREVRGREGGWRKRGEGGSRR